MVKIVTRTHAVRARTHCLGSKCIFRTLQIDVWPDSRILHPAGYSWQSIQTRLSLSLSNKDSLALLTRFLRGAPERAGVPLRLVPITQVPKVAAHIALPFHPP